MQTKGYRLTSLYQADGRPLPSSMPTTSNESANVRRTSSAVRPTAGPPGANAYSKYVPPERTTRASPVAYAARLFTEIECKHPMSSARSNGPGTSSAATSPTEKLLHLVRRINRRVQPDVSVPLAGGELVPGSRILASVVIENEVLARLV